MGGHLQKADLRLLDLCKSIIVLALAVDGGDGREERRGFILKLSGLPATDARRAGNLAEKRLAEYPVQRPNRVQSGKRVA